MTLCRVFFLILVLHYFVELSFSLSCKDEKGRNVDWFIVYKLPKLQEQRTNSNMRDGTAYAYLTANDPGSWKLSSMSVQSTESIIGKTWKGYRSSKRIISHMFYNDEPPTGNGRSSGHLKGFFAFDSTSGFWITHSIPKFARNDTFDYPSNGLNNGQHALCITVNPTEMNDICHHLLYCNPKIYSSQLTNKGETFLDAKAKTLFSKSPSLIKNPPFVKRDGITSRDGQVFEIFSKDNQFSGDLYSDILTAGLRSDLIAETWRRGAGGRSGPTCGSAFTVLHVSSVGMRPSNAEVEVVFSSLEDHSKWAISPDAGRPWICLADLNRMESQQKRGGGAVCFQCATAWRAFRGLVKDTDQCPI